VLIYLNNLKNFPNSKKKKGKQIAAASSQVVALR